MRWLEHVDWWGVYMVGMFGMTACLMEISTFRCGMWAAACLMAYGAILTTRENLRTGTSAGVTSQD